VADKAHTGQYRASGEPYITHPLEVARILANMRLDYQSIMAAMLHDVIEDTGIDKAQINQEFGGVVASLVDGVSKLAQIKFENKAEAQAGNLRKMMLAMSKDIRVVLIKMADRLHNMRTLGALSYDKQKRIALDTLEIYAPIANRLGMNAFRIEFEDLGFAYLYPVRYRILKEAVKKARGNRKEFIPFIEESLKTRFSQDSLELKHIAGREKHLYSLYKKMRTKDLSLSEIMDVYALRVVTDSIDKCYRALGIIHNLYKPIHGRFKDYIAMPKANGYQSLHSTVLGAHGLPVEIQIRTEAMEQMAENGIAAHWLYKSTNIDTENAAEFRAKEWLKEILEIQQSTGSSKEFIKNVKIDLYPDLVYIFTPAGDIIPLPSGATVVDFAYSVRVDIGNACVAAKIDRRLVPLSTRIYSGQTIEIITATEGAHPNPDWLSFVTTSKARSKIQDWLKNKHLADSIVLGKRLVERSLAVLSASLQALSAMQIEKVVKELGMGTEDELFAEVGLGRQIAALVARRLITEQPEIILQDNILPLVICGTEGMVLSYAKCCWPIPGDAILGLLSSGRGIVVHRDTCKNTCSLRKHTEKYIFVQWVAEVIGDFSVELQVDVLNQRGVLAIITSIISEANANIENVYVDERDSRHNSLIFILQVKNRLHLTKIIQLLRAISVVTKVARRKNAKQDQPIK
jgi:guanosine-3',5'-bis(diphosphate) 3'-pyrophosphohydrolase